MKKVPSILLLAISLVSLSGCQTTEEDFNNKIQNIEEHNYTYIKGTLNRETKSLFNRTESEKMKLTCSVKYSPEFGTYLPTKDSEYSLSMFEIFTGGAHAESIRGSSAESVAFNYMTTYKQANVRYYSSPLSIKGEYCDEYLDSLKLGDKVEVGTDSHMLYVSEKIVANFDKYGWLTKLSRELVQLNYFDGVTAKVYEKYVTTYSYRK